MTPWLMLAPFLLAFLLFFVIPALQTLQLSFTDSGLTETHGYVGLANYVELLQDPSFWDSLLQTAYFALLTVIPLTALGLVMAMLINRLTRFAGLVQAIFFIPNILPIAVMAMIGGWMLHPTFGVVNLIAGTEIAWFSRSAWLRVKPCWVRSWRASSSRRRRKLAFSGSRSASSAALATASGAAASTVSTTVA